MSVVKQYFRVSLIAYDEVQAQKVLVAKDVPKQLPIMAEHEELLVQVPPKYGPKIKPIGFVRLAQPVQIKLKPNIVIP